jgi:thiol-disulfide isomerase/thioredoxin
VARATISAIAVPTFALLIVPAMARYAWATWCLPCGWELPEIERAYGRFRDDQRVKFFAVDRGGGKETPARAKAYLDRLRISVPLAFVDASAADALGARAIPIVLVIDKEGRTRLVHQGYDASEHVDEIVSRTVSQLLAEGSR